MKELELRKKYRQERDKRLRKDANDQYIAIKDQYVHYDDDPYTSVQPREPLFDEMDVVCIGGGFSGLVTAVKLKQAGLKKVRIIERGGDFGGTWYWNRYPGAQCDTSALIYLPLLEEAGTVPSEKYVKGPEILAHCQRLAQKFSLYDDACLATQVTEARWDESSARWLISTNRGDKMRARYLVVGPGPLSRPKLPGVDGIEHFQGHSFHSSRWDYEYTGGDTTGALMDKLNDKRVGVIGTGATGVQIIPHLAKTAQELFVFQRTPSSIDVRNNQPMDADWYRELGEGWQDQWLTNFVYVMSGFPVEKDLVDDGWTDLSKRIVKRLMTDPELASDPNPIIKSYHLSDDEKMNEIRARVDELVNDPKTAAALKPWYRQLCKRPCFHDEYLQSFNQSNVHLVDTEGKGVRKIDETGLWVGEQHFDLDCIIFASGFEVGTGFTRVAQCEFYGRDGVCLTDYWSEGMLSLHGLNVCNFPNMFLQTPVQGGLFLPNVPHNIVESAKCIAKIIAYAQEQDAIEVDVDPKAQQEWVEMIDSSKTTSILRDPDCTPGYYNFEGGKLKPHQQHWGGYPQGAAAFFDYIKAWRDSGKFTGLVFKQDK